MSSLLNQFLGNTGDYSGQWGYGDVGLADEDGTFGSGNSGNTTSSGSGSSAGSNSYGLTAQDTGESSSVVTDVASGARAKRTKIYGDGSDQVTLMVYLCGTDLESRSGMATSDLSEMANATIGSNVNVIVYTGGCKQWKNNIISSSHNQILQVKNGGVKVLVDDSGDRSSMTDPDTLSTFIQWCSKKFPANRNELILWDHGGGSVTGYGYDEKNKGKGSMSLSGIQKALKNGGVKFDFIGFDACLMATVETGLMLDDFADYMIASEESEPGIGWYYTQWLTALSKNPGMSTVEIGKMIADDFTTQCAKKVRGQSTTLSVVDLAELSGTCPDKLSAFSKSVSGLIEDKEFATVSSARSGSREFAKGTGIDQVDLTDLALRMSTKEGQELAQVIRSAVKYNRTSRDMTNAYGLSIYFPKKNYSYITPAIQNYEDIGFDNSYQECIQEFAAAQASGQAAAGGTSSPLSSLLGGSYTNDTTYGGDLSDLLGSLLGGDGSSLVGSGGSAGLYGSSGYGSSDSGMGSLLGSLVSGSSGSASSYGGGGLGQLALQFLSGRSLTADSMAEYVNDHHLSSEALTFAEQNDGTYVMTISDDQWELIQGLDQNMFYDDGEGYIDLGLDNLYSFNDQGNLVADTDRSHLAINGQIVAYYHTSTSDDGENYQISGRVPAMLNGERVNLILIFDNDHPKGYIAGATPVYKDGETLTVAKNLEQLQEGDELDFLCDFYDYDGNYNDSYYLGETMTVGSQMSISNEAINDGKISVMYKITDIYNQNYWTDAIEM